MNKENTISMLVLGAIVVGIVLGISLAQKISGEIKEVSSDIKDLETSIKGIDSSIKGVDSSLKAVKTRLTEEETISFRRSMGENGRRMLSLNYAGQFSRWEAVKKEADELDKNLQDSAAMRPDLAQAIEDFRNTYVPKLKDAADKKDTKIFGTAWSSTYDACIACHQIVAAPAVAYEVLREIGSEVEELSG